MTENLFLCIIKIDFKTVKTSSTCLLRSVAASWGGGSELLSPAKIPYFSVLNNIRAKPYLILAF